MDGSENRIDIEQIMDGLRDEIREEQSTRVNVEKIMEEIRAEIERMPKESLPDFAEIKNLPEVQAAQAAGRNPVFQQIANEAQYLKGTYTMPFYWDMGGGIKGFLKRVGRRLSRFMLLPILERQSDFNLHAANGIDALRIGLDVHKAQIDAFQDTTIAHLQLQIQELRKSIDDCARRLAENDDQMSALDRSVDDMSISLARIIRQRTAMSDGAAQTETASEKAVETVQAEMIKGAPPQADFRARHADNYEKIDYIKFQNDFRGTQSQIMERQRIYTPYFRGRKGMVIDLGCGRGEFLRLMKEENIPAYGVDIYPEYEATGRLYGIDIRTGDGIEHLSRIEESLGGIFCAQVIEHLGFENVDKLCRLAHEKLEEGGCLVLETPNPMCVSTMTNGFYIDPTHDKPLHPLLMEYLLKSIGFAEVRLIWPDHSLGALPRIQSGSIDNLEEVNNAIDRVSALLFGSQDYAVVARK